MVILMSASMGAAQTSKQAEYLAALDVFSIDDMRSAFMTAGDHGLSIKNYWTDEMESIYRNAGGADPSLKERSKAAFLRYIQNINTGVMDPGTLGGEFEVRKKWFIDAKQLSVLMLTQGYSAQALVDGLAPQNAPYRGLQEALKRMVSYCVNAQWGAIPAVKKELKLGSKDLLVPVIKERLRQLGYANVTTDDVLDQPTVVAVNDIQMTLHYKPDGKISPNGRTWKYLNTSCNDRIKQIRLDMEKLRWFPTDFGDRYIYVNLAMTYLTMMDKEAGVVQVMKTINGRTARKSPTLIDKITYIVVNPFWIVPPTVFKEDKLSDLRALSPMGVSNYFSKNHYEVWNRAFTRKINPSSIDWNWVDGKSDLYIRQKPGLHNALGVLKFMMTNNFAIYLHDTNARELFSEAERQLSSGCVRVEKPYDLAEHLLQGTKWDRWTLQNQTAQPGQVLSKDTNVNLPKPMPVYMNFQTSQLSSDGVMRFAEDSYGQADRMARFPF